MPLGLLICLLISFFILTSILDLVVSFGKIGMYFSLMNLFCEELTATMSFDSLMFVSVFDGTYSIFFENSNRLLFMPKFIVVVMWVLDSCVNRFSFIIIGSLTFFETGEY